jgi:hypothetical protein
LTVLEDLNLPDTQAVVMDGLLVVGMQPPTDPMDVVRREARLRVRLGLADVLEWLGEDVINEPHWLRLRLLAR